MVRDEFDDAYERVPPWDLGRPQPAVADCADRFTCRVLDVGCGTGEHALFAAARGHEAWGVDTAPRAVERAREKATRRDLDATFRVHDALALGTLDVRFDTALDVDLFHALEPADRAPYAAALRAALRPGGRLVLLCLSERDPHDAGPWRVREDDLRRTFADGWTVEAVDDVPLVWRHLPRPRQALLATVRRS